MSAVRDRREVQTRPRLEPDPGSRDARRSLYFLAWIFVAPILGFALAGRVLDLGAQGDWEIWKATVLGLVLTAPFCVGAFFGLRAVRRGDRSGWVGLVINGILALLAVGMPLREALVG